MADVTSGLSLTPLQDTKKLLIFFTTKNHFKRSHFATVEDILKVTMAALNTMEEVDFGSTPTVGNNAGIRA
jgi:hypothetical protein